MTRSITVSVHKFGGCGYDDAFMVRKNTCNCVMESEMVNSVSVKQAYPFIALHISIDNIHGCTDLCVNKLDFADLTCLVLIRFLR